MLAPCQALLLPEITITKSGGPDQMKPECFALGSCVLSVACEVCLFVDRMLQTA